MLTKGNSVKETGLQRGTVRASSIIFSITAASGSEKLPLGFGLFLPFSSGYKSCQCGQ